MFLISKLSTNDIKVKKQNSCYNCFRGLKFWRDHSHPVIALSEPVIIFVLFWPYMDSAALSELVIIFFLLAIHGQYFLSASFFIFDINR